MIILGIETSCDETAASLLEVSPRLRSGQASFKNQISKKFQVPSLKFQILSNVVASQVDIHKKYGGIVPEVAARQHVQSIIPVIEEALNKNRDTRYTIHDTKPDLIAVTMGPGLITSLQVGVQTAKTLAYVWKVPLVGINHLEAHLWSFLLNSESRVINPISRISNYKPHSTNHIPQFPAIGLIISGGHTIMLLVKGVGKYQLVGQTRDDAVGEAFDKVAKLLNLGYPGGPVISHFAKRGNPNKIKFPRPMIDSRDFDFSFSGIKTAVKYYIQTLPKTGNLSQSMINDICASFQQAVIEVLIEKTIKATKQFKAKSIILGGGVSANESLISYLKSRISNLGIDFYYPEKQFTGDNAAMVALAGFFSQKKAHKSNWQKLTAAPNLKII